MARAWSGVVAAGVLLLAACSSLPPTHYYVLELEGAGGSSAPRTSARGGASAGDAIAEIGAGDVPRAAADAASAPAVSAPAGAGRAAADGWTIGVRDFVVDSPYDQDRIVYRVGERSPEVGFYAYHLWAAPLSSMLPGVVAAGLAGAPGARAIEPVASGRSYDAFLLGRVRAVEEVDVDEGQLVRAVIELRLVVPSGAELWEGVVDARGETVTTEVRRIVEALTQALERALVETQQGLGQALLEASARESTGITR